MLAFETDNYLLRPLSESDISAEWGRWLADTDTANLLNVAPKALNPGELSDYVARFDNRGRILLGIFHKPSGTHIGIFTSTESDRGSEVLWNTLIGAAAFRSFSNFLEIRQLRILVGEYFFFERGYEAAYASVVSHNALMIQYLHAAGWELLKRSTVPRRGDGKADAELLLFRLSRNRWLEREGHASRVASLRRQRNAQSTD